MSSKFLTAWQRFMGLLQLDKRDILQVFYYAIFAGIVSLPLTSACARDLLRKSPNTKFSIFIFITPLTRL